MPLPSPGFPHPESAAHALSKLTPFLLLKALVLLTWPLTAVSVFFLPQGSSERGRKGQVSPQGWGTDFRIDFHFPSE